MLNWTSYQHIGHQAKQCTRMNKTVNVDKAKHIFIILVLPTKSVSKH